MEIKNMPFDDNINFDAKLQKTNQLLNITNQIDRISKRLLYVSNMSQMQKNFLSQYLKNLQQGKKHLQSLDIP